MKPRTVVLLALLLFMAAVPWFIGRKSTGDPALSRGSSLSKFPTDPIVPPEFAPSPPPPPDLPAAPPPAPPRIPPLPSAEKRDLANPLVPGSFAHSPLPRPGDSDADAAVDFDKVALMLRDYRTIAGENPVGSNAEIIKSMMGENPRGAKLGPPEGMSLNGEGALVDHWGTPLFFHQLSSDLMEVHSAGPDRRMGTEDDLIQK